MPFTMRMIGCERSKDAPSIYPSELICPSSPSATPPVVLKRGAADSNFGLNELVHLSSVWFYDAPLKADTIRAALQSLVDRFPTLAARRTVAGIELNNKGARFSCCDNKAGSAWELAGTYQHVTPSRGELCDHLGTAMDADAPLFTVRVTNLCAPTPNPLEPLCCARGATRC